MATLATKSSVVELNEQDQRAIRAFIQWLEMAEQNGSLEIYEYQKDTIEKLKTVAS